MNDDELREKMWAALQAEPKPLTSERVLELATEHLPKVKATQFGQWFEKNGSSLLERLNGQ